MDVTAISNTGYSRTPAPISGADGTTSGAINGADAHAEAAGAKSGASQVPYVSPVYKFDPVAQLNVLTFRDERTGTVTQQYPAEKVVEQYRRNHGEPPAAAAAGTAGTNATQNTTSGTYGAQGANTTAAVPQVAAGSQAAGSGGDPGKGSGSGTSAGSGAWSSSGAGTGAWLPTGTGTGSGTNEVTRVSLRV